MGDDDGKTGTGSDGGEKDWRAEADRWKALSRKNEADLRELQRQVAASKSDADTSKGELNALTAELKSMRAELAESRRRELVAEVAEKFELTPRQARRLTGTTREELVADAAEMVEDFGIKKKDAGKTDGASGKPAGDGKGDGASDRPTGDGKTEEDQGRRSLPPAALPTVPQEKAASGSVPNTAPAVDYAKLASDILTHQ